MNVKNVQGDAGIRRVKDSPMSKAHPSSSDYGATRSSKSVRATGELRTEIFAGQRASQSPVFGIKQRPINQRIHTAGAARNNGNHTSHMICSVKFDRRCESPAWNYGATRWQMASGRGNSHSQGHRIRGYLAYLAYLKLKIWKADITKVTIVPEITMKNDTPLLRDNAMLVFAKTAL